MDQWSKIAQNKPSHIWSYDFQQDDKTTQCGKIISLVNMLGNLDIYKQKNDGGLLPYTIYKN